MEMKERKLFTTTSTSPINQIGLILLDFHLSPQAAVLGTSGAHYSDFLAPEDS